MKYNMGKKIILMYHRVDDTKQDYNRITVNESNFKAQMEYLKQTYKVLSFEELLYYEGSDDVFAITFDDGFSNFYTKALPILENLDLPSTIFITTGKLLIKEELWTSEIIRLLYENDSGLDKIYIVMNEKRIYLPISTLEQRAVAYRIIRQFLMQSSEKEIDDTIKNLRMQLGMDKKGRGGYSFLSPEIIQLLSRNPLITIGAHTVNHLSLGKVRTDTLTYEIKNSIESLESIIGRKIKYFAYPFGNKSDYSLEAMDILKQYGIDAAVTTYKDFYNENAYTRYEIPRVYIGNWNVEYFQKYLDNVFHNKSMDKFENDIFIGSIQDNNKIFQEDSSIFIWGIGVRGKFIASELEKLGVSKKIKAFLDNNKNLWGNRLLNIPIESPDSIRNIDNSVILVYNAHDVKICKQLISMNAKGIHWVI